MKEWSDLEDRYQQMMTSDPAAAQSFRQRMTARFQANVQVCNNNILFCLALSQPSARDRVST